MLTGTENQGINKHFIVDFLDESCILIFAFIISNLFQGRKLFLSHFQLYCFPCTNLWQQLDKLNELTGNHYEESLTC